MKRSTEKRPTRAELDRSLRRRVPDVIGPRLQILFCGINPGRYSAALGHHFAGPSNRFWRTMHAAGFTPRLFSPREDAELLRLGFGITNLASRTTARANLLPAPELKRGARMLRRKVRRYRPKVLAIVGLGAYRTAFGVPTARTGLQPEVIDSTRVWLLPNPSGLNAHHQPAELARLFAELRDFARSL
ncbi:MAG TPA: G/U mismatch-specific DNA glycosylase [Kofleriaceae bacterium]|nr:G/U mismatch-specific DNA glycosylase [Kofleriaceae bacterium]